MSPELLNKLVNAYVERYSKQFQWDKDNVLVEQDINFWVWEEFERLVNEEPEAAWLAVLAILEATTDEYTLGMLAAGPLEDLVDQHGESFVDRIEMLARSDLRFRALLNGVWESSSPEIWGRIVRAQVDSTRS